MSPLTKAAHRILIEMEQAERENRLDDAELVGERNEWWVGYRRTTWRTVKQLLQRCLIRCVSLNSSDRVQRYTINEHGRKAILDRTFVPAEIIAALEDSP